jgi:hypothetical protein
MTRRTRRVRPSTVVLIALFVGASVLYLFVRPTNPSTVKPPVTTIAR